MGKNARNRKNARNVAERQSPRATSEDCFKDTVFNPAPWLDYATDALARISMRLSESGTTASWALQGEKGVHAELLITTTEDGIILTTDVYSPADAEVAEALDSITHAVGRSLFNASQIDYVVAVGHVAVMMADFFHLMKDVPKLLGGICTQINSWEALRQAYADASFEHSFTSAHVNNFSRGITLQCGARIDIQFLHGVPHIEYPDTCAISADLKYYVMLWAESFATSLRLKQQHEKHFTDSSLELQCMLQASLLQSMLATVLSSHAGKGCGPHEFALPSWLQNNPKKSERAA